MAKHIGGELVVGAITLAAAHNQLAGWAIFHSEGGSHAGFNWSSHHLDIKGLRLEDEDGEAARVVWCTTPMTASPARARLHGAISNAFSGGSVGILQAVRHPRSDG